MAFKSLSSRQNLAFDLGLSALIAVLVTVSSFYWYWGKESLLTWDMFFSILSATLGLFFLIFIWTWKREYIESDKVVKTILEVLFLLMFISFAGYLFSAVLPLFFIHDRDFTMIAMGVGMTLWFIAVAVKYHYMFRRKVVG